ncbi:Cro/CI family transcriptional regulator [Enterobacter cloacae]
MLTTDAIEFFGTKTKLAEIAGVSQAAVSRWVKAGYPWCCTSFCRSCHG